MTVLLAATLAAGCLSPEERRQRVLERVDEAVAAGDTARAMDVLREALAYDHGDAVVATRLAEILEADGQPRQALRVLDRLPPAPPRGARFRNLEGRLRLAAGDVRRGVEILAALQRENAAEKGSVDGLVNEVVERRRRPSDTGPLPADWVADLLPPLLATANVPLALEWIGELPPDHPSRPRLEEELLETALRAEAEDSLLPRLARLAARPDTPARLLILRRWRQARGEGAAVARLEDRFLLRFPHHPRRQEIVCAAARRALATGELDRALALVDETLKLTPDWSAGLVLKGYALRSLGREEQAKRAFTMALALDPENAAARGALAGRDGPEGLVRLQLVQ